VPPTIEKIQELGSYDNDIDVTSVEKKRIEGSKDEQTALFSRDGIIVGEIEQCAE